LFDAGFDPALAPQPAIRSADAGQPIMASVPNPSNAALGAIAPAAVRTGSGPCRSCGSGALTLVVDLGPQPPAERFVAPAELAAPDEVLDLRILVCTTCWLVQLEGEPVPPGDEPGGLAFSVSPTMRAHIDGLVDDALAHAGDAAGAVRGTDLRIVEVASHGNRLAERFRARGARSLLVEAVPHYAADAEAAGVATVGARLTPDVAAGIVADGGPADLFVDAFYLAHDPRPDEYLAGVARLLADDGVAVFEFDHLLPVMVETQYDGFRHGHASYLSLGAFTRLLERAGLVLEDALTTPAYGGSVRAFVRRRVRPGPEEGARAILAAETDAGLQGLGTYRAFAERVAAARTGLRAFLDERRRAGDLVVAYGAPSRGNTLLNSSAVTPADVPFAVDRSGSKQGRYLPGSRIPILPVERVAEVRPAYLLILTWDLRDEVIEQMAGVRSWGGRFVVPLPELTVVD
jgi:hypothetical protein